MFVTRPLLCQDRQPNAERKRCTMGNRGGESRLIEGVYAEGKEKGGKRSKGKVRLSEEWRATLFSACTLSLIWPIIYSTKAVDKWQLLLVSPSSSNRIPTKWILNYISSERSVNNNEKNKKQCWIWVREHFCCRLPLAANSANYHKGANRASPEDEPQCLRTLSSGWEITSDVLQPQTNTNDINTPPTLLPCLLLRHIFHS